MRYASKNERICASTTDKQFAFIPTIGILRRREQYTFAIGFLWLNFTACINLFKRRGEDAAD